MVLKCLTKVKKVQSTGTTDFCLSKRKMRTMKDLLIQKTLILPFHLAWFYSKVCLLKIITFHITWKFLHGDVKSML